MQTECCITKINIMSRKIHILFIFLLGCFFTQAQNIDSYSNFSFRFSSKTDMDNFYSCEYEFSPLMMPVNLSDLKTNAFKKEIDLFKNSAPKEYHYFNDFNIPSLDYSYQKQNGITTVIATLNGFEFYKSTYKNGLLDGKISFFFVDGTLFQEFEFKKGMANGLHKIYDKNGNLILETHYKNNIKNGIRTYYIPRRDEQISLSGNYENGAIIGDLTYKISDYHYYILPNDLEKGTFKEYYQNKLKRQYSTKTNNTIDGDFLEYYPETETLSAKIPYKFGVVDGICEFYDTKGNLYNKLEYKNGRKIGTHKNISEKGRLYAEEYYDNKGKKTGNWKQYNSYSNELSKETNYLNDSIHGTQTTYYKGKIESLENYKNGIIQTRKLYDNKTETLKAEYNYTNGNVEQTLEYLPSGILTTKYQKLPNNTAVQIFYDLQGNKLTENYYNEQSKPIGIHKNYNYYSGEPFLQTITEYEDNNNYTQTYYFQNGSYNISRYKNQQKHGAQTQYNKQTNTTTTYYIIKDKKVTQEEFEAFEKSKKDEKN